MPKWWLWTFYATIVWAIGYWALYPAWPTLAGYTGGARLLQPAGHRHAGGEGGTRGAGGDARGTLPHAARQGAGEPRAPRFAMTGGAAAFASNCAACHGRGAQGFVGYPNLNDDDWLWAARWTTSTAPCRWGSGPTTRTRASARCRSSASTGFTSQQINDTADYVLSLSGQPSDRPGPIAARRSSPSSAPPVTARTARAASTRARPTSPTRSRSTAAARPPSPRASAPAAAA